MSQMTTLNGYIGTQLKAFDRQGSFNNPRRESVRLFGILAAIHSAGKNLQKFLDGGVRVSPADGRFKALRYSPAMRRGG